MAKYDGSRLCTNYIYIGVPPRQQLLGTATFAGPVGRWPNDDSEPACRCGRVATIRGSIGVADKSTKDG